jgi:DNA polymerase/3'-5' exonuclease PolX
MVSSVEDYNIEVCGSYRREKAFCGDIDIIISRKDGTYEKSLLSNFVK